MARLPARREAYLLPDPGVSRFAGTTTGRATTSVRLLRAWGRRLGSVCVHRSRRPARIVRHLRIDQLLLTPWAGATSTIPITSNQAKSVDR
jgi:hypothetical protein